VTEFFKIFDAAGAVSIQQVLAFAALIVPGFISLRVYESRSGGEPRKVAEALVDVVVYSLATDVIAYAGFTAVATFVPEPARSPVGAIFATLIFVVVPVAFALLLFEMRERLKSYGFLPDTRTKLWDRIAGRVASGQIDLGVILTLRDGRKIGGRVRRAEISSHASSDDIMVGEVWTIDQERATFVKAVEGSFGVLVERSECDTIELFEWANVVPDDSGRTAM
jgi:Family of unknown function (DUF6338)